MLDKAIPVKVVADTARIVTGDDTETFNWIRKNYCNADAIPTLIYVLTSKMGKWDKSDLVREMQFFQSQHSEFVNRTDKLQQVFKELKHKEDADSRTRLLDVINDIIDVGICTEQSQKAAEVFENFIPTNERAAEDLRKQAVGEKLKSARMSAGFTQEQVGKSIGVSKARVSDYEAGKTEPPIKTLLKLVKLLNLSLDDLYEIKKI